jgi:hypothetical protein
MRLDMEGEMLNTIFVVYCKAIMLAQVQRKLRKICNLSLGGDSNPGPAEY